MVTRQSTQSTTAGFAAKLARVHEALLTLPGHLPAIEGISSRSNPERWILTPSVYAFGWDRVAGLLPWSSEFGVDVHVSLSSLGGSGDVVVSFEHFGVLFELKAYVGTAEAYQLGGVMGRPLSPDKSVTLSADELRSALTLIGGA